MTSVAYGNIIVYLRTSNSSLICWASWSSMAHLSPSYLSTILFLLLIAPVTATVVAITTLKLLYLPLVPLSKDSHSYLWTNNSHSFSNPFCYPDNWRHSNTKIFYPPQVLLLSVEPTFEQILNDLSFSWIHISEPIILILFPVLPVTLTTVAIATLKIFYQPLVPL